MARLEEITIDEAKALAVGTILPKQSDIVGFGIGHSRPHLNVYVKEERCCKHVPGEFAGYETRTIVVGELRTLPGANLAAHQQRYRPALGGTQIAVSPPAGGGWFGTFGCVVYDVVNGTKYILTNNHVAAGANSLPIGTVIYQPVTGQRIGTLFKYGKLYVDGAAQKNEIDAALVLPDNQDDIVDEILGVGIVDRAIEPKVNMDVECAGARGYYDMGRIIDVVATFRIGGYPEMVGPTGHLTFYNCVVVLPPVGEAGQSGGIIVEKSSKAGVSHLFAGSESVTVGNWLLSTLDDMGTDMLGKTSNPPGSRHDSQGGGLPSSTWESLKRKLPYMVLGGVGLVTVAAVASRSSRSKR